MATWDIFHLGPQLLTWHQSCALKVNDMVWRLERKPKAEMRPIHSTPWRLGIGPILASMFRWTTANVDLCAYWSYHLQWICMSNEYIHHTPFTANQGREIGLVIYCFRCSKKTKVAWQGLLLLDFSHCCREKTSRDAWDLSATSKATKPGVTFLGVPWCRSWCLVIVYVGFASGAYSSVWYCWLKQVCTEIVTSFYLFFFERGPQKHIFLGDPGVESKNVTLTGRRGVL